MSPMNEMSHTKPNRLLGISAAVAICVVAAVVGGLAVYRSAGDVIGTRTYMKAGTAGILPAETTHRELWLTGKQFIDGLITGSIRPETGVRIASELFIDASDGVLTKEEIGSILDQLRRVHGMNL